MRITESMIEIFDLKVNPRLFQFFFFDKGQVVPVENILQIMDRKDINCGLRT
jgi:hypothetical protein